MCSVVCSVVTLSAGAALVVLTSVLGYVLVPSVVRSIIVSEVVLKEDTVQMERFQELPFPVNFTVRMFNVSNAAAVAQGAVPALQELGPWVYRLFQTREVLGVEGDLVRYRRHERFEFDAAASFPNTEDDIVTIINVPYLAVTQIAEQFYPELARLLDAALPGVFGEQLNAPLASFRVGELLLRGVRFCSGGGVVAAVACALIRNIGANVQNLQALEDGSVVFSVLGYKEQLPSAEYVVHRGLQEPADLGRIVQYANASHFAYWRDGADGPGVCNAINGTDAGIFPPFVTRDTTLYAINTDICRSVMLRYQYDTQYEGIPAVRVAANEWLLDNSEGCFCLNVTSGGAGSGLNRPDGCLLPGAMELYTCIGAFLVLSYPHFLFAHPAYGAGVLGMAPDLERHRIFMDIEPNTGTPVRGAKRAQFNMFLRPVAGIAATQPLRSALVPFIWFEEGISLPEEFVEELSSRLLARLRLVDILIPVLIAASAALAALGAGCWMRARRSRRAPPVLGTAPPSAATQKPLQ